MANTSNSSKINPLVALLVGVATLWFDALLEQFGTIPPQALLRFWRYCLRKLGCGMLLLYESAYDQLVTRTRTTTKWSKGWVWDMPEWVRIRSRWWDWWRQQFQRSPGLMLPKCAFYRHTTFPWFKEHYSQREHSHRRRPTAPSDGATP